MKKYIKYILDATHLRGNQWAVKPKGQLGTCGWYPGPWMIVYVTAPNEKTAIRKAHAIRDKAEAAHKAAQK